MSDQPPVPRCLYCRRDSDQVPLLPVRYHGADYHICSEHLPILIHQPEKLAGLLPGAERIPPADEH